MDEKNSVWKGIISDYFTNNDGEDPFNEDYDGDYQPDLGNTRQILNVLFMIDVSGSMRGTRIASVNYAMENIIRDLQIRDDAYSVIKIGIMEFSHEAIWKTPQPVLAEDYLFKRIEAQPWYTSYSSAFLALEKKLHKAEFMDPNMGEYFAPLILFITDGEPVDLDEYPKALEKLKANKWFRKSAKYAIAAGEECKNSEVLKVLTQFTGNRDNVRYADDGEGLCNLIEFITVRASEVQTSVVTNGTDGNDSIFSEFDKGSSLFSSMFEDR